MHEIELKYRVTNIAFTLEKLTELGAIETAIESHEDTYYRHPCRDFASTGEALRVRRCDGIAFITYKGAKQVLDSGNVSGIKLRSELEWSLSPADTDGMKTDLLLRSLGFSVVAKVSKQRRPFSVVLSGVEAVVTIDTVDGIGTFTEIEVLCADGETIAKNGPTQTQAIETIGRLAEQLNAGEAEPRSYLRMVLDATGAS